MNDQPRAVVADGAPPAIGPYSQAIVVGDWVFCSGQIGLHPQSGELVGDDAATQAEQALRNLTAVLAAAGADLADVVKTQIFLVDIADFARVNEVYARFMPTPPPARSTIAVAALPRGARVEIEAIARRRG